MSDHTNTISVYLEPTKRKLTLDLAREATIGDVVQGMVTHLSQTDGFDIGHFLREKIGDGQQPEWQLFREGANMQLLPPEARFSELQPPLELDEMFMLKVNAKVAAEPEPPKAVPDLLGDEADSAALLLGALLTRMRVPFRFALQRSSDGAVRDVRVELHESTPEQVAAIRRKITEYGRLPPGLEFASSAARASYDDVNATVRELALRILHVVEPEAPRRVPAPVKVPGSARLAASKAGSVPPATTEQENWIGFCCSWRIEVRGSGPRDRQAEQAVLNLVGTDTLFRRLRREAAAALATMAPTSTEDDIRYAATICAREQTLILTAWVQHLPDITLAKLVEDIPRLVE